MEFPYTVLEIDGEKIGITSLDNFRDMTMAAAKGQYTMPPIKTWAESTQVWQNKNLLDEIRCLLNIFKQIEPGIFQIPVQKTLNKTNCFKGYKYPELAKSLFEAVRRYLAVSNKCISEPQTFTLADFEKPAFAEAKNG